MSIISKQDTNGDKPLLLTGELGYDNYPAGGDVGRVFVGTGTENIGLAKKTEVMAVDGKADTHIARVDNPHNVTKAQVGLGNADNTADVDKSVLSATKLTTPRNIAISGEVVGSASFDGSTDINISTTIQPNSVALGTDTTGNYVDSVIAGEGITVTGVVGEGGTPSIAIAAVGTSGTYTKVSTNDKGQVVSGELLTANDIPNLDASKITSGIIDAARLPASAGNIPEYATLSEFPIVGDSGKVYIALDTNKMYRWSGSTYVSIAGGVDSVAGKTGAVSLGKGDVGLTNVDNTSDANKPISTATQNALNTKVDTTTNQTIAGVKTFSSTIAGSISGNSATATKLATARTIGGVSFDGTADINLPGVNTPGNQNTTGNAATATRLSTTRANYKTSTDSVVVGELMWKNYGNQHTIFDASNSTTPIGTATNNINPDNAWDPTYPTLMGFNGTSTYGVRVDSSRYADSAGRAYPRLSGGADLNFYWSGQGGQPTWLWGGNDGANMYVYNPSNFSVNYANSAGSAGTSTHSTYMWSTTHSGSYYVKNSWTGSYWRLDSNHPSGCSVAHADYANSAGSVSASAVASGTAGIDAGGVGSYAFMELIAGNEIAVGSTTAGSNLRYVCITNSYTSTAPILPSGTWRVMGTGKVDNSTLWLRIA